ncbi:AraC family transcriptional regulator [Paenibacillus oryzisoli]|uniref:helix-turn-helix transcriptional regulator n=1 Tax=Paenibacillus oryzisoli TaxID=1850517 RepID=UPI003D281799
MDINEMAAHYAEQDVRVVGVFRAAVPAHTTLHTHSAERLTPTPGYVFVTKGSGTFVFNGTPYTVQAGTVLHGGRQMTLTMRTESAELEYTLVRYTLGAQGAAPVRSGPIAHEVFQLEPGFHPAIAELLGQLYESFFMPGHMALLRTGSLAKMLLYELFSACLNRQNDSSREMVEQARDYIHTKYMEPITLQKLADRYGKSAQSFSYFFKKHTGVFPIDYLIQHRMKRAQELLTTGSGTIKQIAESVGYADALYFSRLYKKFYGYTPSQAQQISED